MPIEIIKEEHDKNIVLKKWGSELILHNRSDYCGKILSFHKGGKFSMHFHMDKTETWYVNSGIFNLTYIETLNADKINITLTQGDIVEIDKGLPHQLEAITDGEIFEVSTIHHDYDSYRVEKGDNQC